MRISRQTSLLVALALLACGEESTGPSAVASVDVTPPAPTLSAGQTVSLAAVARDASGRALTDRAISWSSENPSAATVSPAGAVTGVAAGTAEIIATAEGIEGSTTVTVLPPAVTSVAVEPPQVSLLPGETAQLTATARDAQNGTLTGVAFTWVSNDVSVATVDPSGLVTSVAPGAATVYAVAGGRSGGAAVGVVDPDAPRVLSVSPPELVEGAAATLSGVNFSAVPAENVVTVDGVRATVTGASETSVDIVVPPLACRPRHLATVAVAVGPRASQSSFPVRPATSFQLAPGQITLLRDPPAYCLQFGASAADEEYLVGIQSTAHTPSTLDYVLVTGEKDATAPASLAAAPPLRAPASFSPQVPDPLADRVLQWRAREAEVMHREVEQARTLPREAPAAAPGASPPALVPGNVTVGTQVVLRYPNLDFANTCQNYVEITGTVRYVGPAGIWVSDNANPESGYDDTDYVDLGDEFEQDIYPTVTDYFGQPADEDANGRIVVVVTKEVNADGIGGIVPSANLFPRTTCPASNEGEYFFMIAPDPAGQYEFVLSREQARSVSSAILGHELVHNVHLSRRAAAGHSYWDSWMHEGQATLGEEIMGHALTPGRGPGQNYGWTVIRNEAPDNIATRRWYYDAFTQLFLYYGWSGAGNPTISTDAGSEKRPNTPEGCTFLDTPAGNNAGLCANRGLLVYGVSWAFMRWLTDQYAAGLGGEPAMHQAWIDGSLGGFPSIEALVGEEIETLLAHWAASLYLDDRPPVAGSLDPLLTLPSWDLYDIESHVASEARLEPRVHAFDDFSQTVQVRAGSTAYFLVSGGNRPSTAIRVRSPTGGFLSPNMQIWVVRVR